MKEMVGGCCVCSDDRGWPENPLVYCDGQSCTVAVHQACYGIVTVPTGPWYCRKCESQERSVKVKCELCPSKYGALKRTDTSAWAHVVCALYIPEVRFGNVTTMEPIQLQMIPAERFNKSCYICEESGKASQASVGACMQCNKSGCKQQFHVTCAQGLGLLCEEAGNYLDNVKYCGYCQHHYSKLKKGGNVKTIPPYKPVSTENHHSDSSSEREQENTNSAKPPQPPQGNNTSSKRKSSSSSKTSTSSTKSSSSSKSSTHQKVIHSSSNKTSAEKPKSNTASIKSVKNNVTDENSCVSDSVDAKNSDGKRDSKESEDSKEVKEHDKSKGKKRKANSRTPTPISVVAGIENINAVIGVPPITEVAAVVVTSEKRDNLSIIDGSDKIKKVKTDTIHTSIIHQQSTTPTIIPPTINSKSPSPIIPEILPTTSSSPTRTTAVSTPSIIQSVPTQPTVNSLVVSVPLHSASLSPHTHIVGNQTKSVSAASSPFLGIQERSPSITSSPPANNIMTGANSNQTGVITSEMSGGGLKITYEKQVPPPNSTLQIDLERVTPTPEIPAKRSRSESTEKNEKTRKKRGSHTLASLGPTNSTTMTTKRASRSQSSLDLAQQSAASYGALPQNSIKESPPSSPSSESLGSAPTNGRKKGRKSAPASVCSTSNPKDTKDSVKVFQNGIHAPHMLGNQLNPNSNMAQKMSDHLSSELEAHSIFNQNETSCNLVGPPLQHRVIASVRSNSTGGSSTASGGSGLSSMLGGSSGALPQTLEQLLERHWEQGSQFLMEQAQHFDIASLLTCLHQLRAENLRLEEHVTALVQRRDHLLAINARLALPLVSQPSSQVGNHSHTANNIHPHVSSTQVPDNSRQRHSNFTHTSTQGPIENGLPPDQYSHQHRSPVTAQPPQPSPQSVRHSPAGNTTYSTSGLMRQSTTESSSRSTSRSQQQYQIPYQNSSTVSQQQMLMRRESDLHHQSVNKPS